MKPTLLQKLNVWPVMITMVSLHLVLCLATQVSAEYIYGQKGSSSCNYSPGFSRYHAMTDDVSGQMNIQRVWFYRDSGTDAAFRFAFFSGGGTMSPYDPAGAVQIYDSGELVHTGFGWESFPITSPLIISSASFGMALKSSGDDFSYDCTLPWNGPPADDIKQEYVLLDEPADPSIPFASPVASGLAIDTYIYAYTTTMYPETYFYFDYLAVPVISDVTYGAQWTDESPNITTVNDGQTNLWINGFGFESLDEFGADTSHVWLTQNDSWEAPGTTMEQPVETWFDSTFGHQHIKFTVDYGILPAGSTAYLWVENSDGQVNQAGIPLLLQTSDATAPEAIADTLSVTPSSGTYFYPSGWPSQTITTATQEFQDTETHIYACEFSLDNGATWQPAEISGTWPDYVCTKESLVRFSDDPYVLINNGDLINLQMRALSGGGTSTPVSTLQLTADKLPPVPGGGFIATPGNKACTVSWNPAVDAGVGLHPTAAYTVSWSTNRAFGPETTSFTHTNLGDGTYSYGLTTKDIFNRSASYGSTIECVVPWVYVEEATDPVSGKAGPNSTDVAVSTFALRAKTLEDSITSLSIECGGYSGYVETVKIYRDDGSVANTHDTDDTLIATSTFVAGTAVFTDLNIPVTTTAQQYLIAYDITGTPPNGTSLGGHVSAATAQNYAVTVSDNRDYAIALESNPPSTTDDTPADWQNDEVTITFTPTDDDAGVDPATGIYACFGEDCTPVQLGGNSLTTNCGAGNVCSYAVRYYSVDRADNAEEVKTAANTIRIDRIPPTDGTFTVWSGNYGVPMEWSGFSDEGSGLDPAITYVIRRRMDEAPPDCSSWYEVYEGADTEYTMESAAAGREHFFRVCAVDQAGNMSPGVVGSAWVDEACNKNVYCESCHAWPPLDLPPSAPDPKDPETGATIGSHGPHAMLGDPPEENCLICHFIPGDDIIHHVDGFVRIRDPLQGGGFYDMGNPMGDHREIMQEPFRPTGSCWDTSATSCHGAGPSPPW